MAEEERLAVIEKQQDEEEEEEEEEVWTWGAGTDGQLGTGKLQDEHFPIQLYIGGGGASVSLLSCGGAHVIALTTGTKPSLSLYIISGSVCVYACVIAVSQLRCI